MIVNKLKLKNFWKVHRIKTTSLLSLVILSYLFWAWQHRPVTYAVDFITPTPIASPTTYTLQIMSGTNAHAIENYIQTHHLTDQARVMKTQYKGHDWYVLAYGQYNKVSQARMALATLSDAVKPHHPWVRSTKQLSPIGRP